MTSEPTWSLSPTLLIGVLIGIIFATMLNVLIAGATLGHYVTSYETLARAERDMVAKYDTTQVYLRAAHGACTSVGAQMPPLPTE